MWIVIDDYTGEIVLRNQYFKYAIGFVYSGGTRHDREAYTIIWRESHANDK